MWTWQDIDMIGAVPLMEALPYAYWVLLLCSGHLVQVHGLTNGNIQQNAAYTTKSSAVSMSRMDMGLWIALGLAGVIILILAVVILSIVLRRRVCQEKSDAEDIISPEEVPTSIDRKPSADNIYDELPEEEDTGYRPVLPPSEERPPSYRTATRSLPSQTDHTTDIDANNSEVNDNVFPPDQGDMADVSRHPSYDNIPGMGLEAYVDVDEIDEENSSSKADDNADDNDVTPSVDPVYAIIDETNGESETSGTKEVEEREDGIQPPCFVNSVSSNAELSKLYEGSTAVYAVVDKTKKKKNRESETSGTIEVEEGEDGIQPPSFVNSVSSITESSKLDRGSTDVYAVIDKTKKKKNRDSEARYITEPGEAENGIHPSSIVQRVSSLTGSSTLLADEHSADVYAVIDKIKKKNRDSETSGTSEPKEGENGIQPPLLINSISPLTESSKQNEGVTGAVEEKHSRLRSLIESFTSP